MVVRDLSADRHGDLLRRAPARQRATGKCFPGRLQTVVDCGMNRDLGHCCSPLFSRARAIPPRVLLRRAASIESACQRAQPRGSPALAVHAGNAQDAPASLTIDVGDCLNLKSPGTRFDCYERHVEAAKAANRPASNAAPQADVATAAPTPPPSVTPVTDPVPIAAATTSSASASATGSSTDTQASRSVRRLRRHRR